MTSKRYLKIDQKYVDKVLFSRPPSRGCPGFIFDRFLMILGSMFECIFDDIYAWYAVFFICFHLHLRLDSGDIAAVLMFDSYNIDVE